MAEQFDLVIIGAGPGGYVAAIEASKNGMHTAIVEKADLGGTCLNNGCIPTKTLLNSVRLYRELKNGGDFGIMSDHIALNIEKAYERKDEVVQKLREGIALLMEQNEVTVFYDEACIEENHTIYLKKSKERLFAKAVMIAAGGESALPDIPGIGHQKVYTSETLLAKPHPDIQSLIIIGGGIIGVEFASIFSGFGYQVTVLEAKKQILYGMDSDIGRQLKAVLKKQGVKVITDVHVEKVCDGEAGSVCCIYNLKGENKILAADAVLAATGRRSKAETLFLGMQDMPVIKNGCLQVDEHFQTSVQGIYAIGDVTGKTALAHAASAQAICAVNAIAGREIPVDKTVIPSCVYTSPEAACTGITEDEARAQGYDVIVHKYSMSGNGKSVLTGNDRGFIKVVADRSNHCILGAQMVCERASDMISEFTMAIVNHLTLTDMAKAVRPHPTYSEAISDSLL